MEFYRHVTEEDFKYAFSELDHKIPLPLRVFIIAELRITHDIVISYQDKTGQNLSDCKAVLDKYLTTLKAYFDFKKGIQIYTKY